MFVRTIALFALLGQVCADHVISLTSKTFDAHVKANKQTLVEFYAPWCGHCKKLAPEFEKAASELAGRNIPLAQVDATEEKDLAGKYNVRGFPTLVWFEEGKNSEYDGGRTGDAIVEWVSAMAGAAVIVTSMPPEVTTDKPRVVLYADQVLFSFEAVAKQNRRKAAWYYVKEGGTAKVVLTHKGESPVELSNPSDEATIQRFVAENAMPLFGPMDGDTFDKYMSSEKGLVWSLFSDIEGMTPQEVDLKYRPMMTEVAQKVKGQFSVTYTDTEKFKEAVESMLGVTEFPAIVVQKKAGDKLRYVHRGDMTAAAITSFINDASAGRVSPFLKSEVEPTGSENRGLIKKIVGTTFDREVFTNDRDVMLEVYAPWCGHCKKLDPEYEKLAEKVKDAGLQHVLTIAKLDGTANDSPNDKFDWSSFPTIYYIRAGDRTPSKFEGERTYKGLLKYIKKHATKADLVRERLDKQKPKKGDEL